MSKSSGGPGFELELELIQTHMAQKPVLRVEVGARAYAYHACMAQKPIRQDYGHTVEALCAAPPEVLSHSPSQMPLSCPVAPQAARS